LSINRLITHLNFYIYVNNNLGHLNKLTVKRSIIQLKFYTFLKHVNLSNT